MLYILKFALLTWTVLLASRLPASAEEIVWVMVTVLLLYEPVLHCSSVGFPSSFSSDNVLGRVAVDYSKLATKPLRVALTHHVLVRAPPY
jgi:hypothetical protein